MALLTTIRTTRAARSSEGAGRSGVTMEQTWLQRVEKTGKALMIGRNSKKVPSLVVAGLQRFLEEHRTVGGRAEPDFIRIGSLLQEVHGEAAELTRQIHGTIALLGSRDSGVLASLRNNAEQSLQELRDSRQEVGAKLESVEAVFDHLGVILRETEGLARIGMHLRAIGVNVGVESTRSAEALAMFATVSQEVVQLAANILAVAEAITTDCQEGRNGQQQAHDEIVRNLRRLDGVALEVEKAVREAFGRIETVLDHALTALEGANDHALAIGTQVGEIVMRIQLHDSMSQRVEHIAHALLEVIDDLQRPENAGKEGARLRALAKAGQVVVLQVSQIGHIIEEIEEANHNGLQAFEIIDRQVQDLLLGLTGLQHAKKTGRPAGGQPEEDTLATLQSSLAHLNGLVADGAAMVAGLNDCARQASSMASRLFGHKKSIEDIRFAIHLKALNTIVKASHLGDRGRTMEVLAQETKQLSDHANDFVDDVVRIHDSLGQSVLALEAEGAEKGRGALLESSISAIAEAMAGFNAGAAAASAQGDTLQAAIARASGELGFLQALAGELRGQCATLQAVGDLIAPWVRQDEAEGHDMALSGLAARYTMKKERDLHTAFVAGVAAAATNAAAFEVLPEEKSGASPPADESAGGAGEALGDNVELF